MKGHAKWWMVAGALALVVAGTALAQGGEAEKPGEPGEEAMAAMMAAGKPGEHHQHLAMLVGEWTYASKFWNPGASEPSEMAGTMKAEPMLGGRFIRTTWSGEFMGMPFEGIGIDGYDNAKQHYTSTWRDNFGTYTLFYTGHCEDGGKVRFTEGVYTDPATGEEITDKGKTTHRDDGTVLMESWRVAADGTESKMMEITLTKR